MLIVLDSGPLGLLSNPTKGGKPREARQWAERRLQLGDRFVVPEIADYELRRELVRGGRHQGLARLGRLCEGLGYEPLTTAVMRAAAELWADARNAGLATAKDAALDGDVILASQARNIQATQIRLQVVVATTNPAHLSRYTAAREWSSI